MKLNLNRNELIPAIIQDANTKDVLMLGYMNQEALDTTLTSNRVTFFSRSKQRLWTKGEESGNFLNLVSLQNDCDADTLLIQVNPVGPTCHKGTKTCWGEPVPKLHDQIEKLENTITNRIENPSKDSYVSSLMARGVNKVAQKVGEEAVEVVIEAVDNNKSLFLEESADLFFHYLLLLQAKGYRIKDILEILKKREQ